MTVSGALNRTAALLLFSAIALMLVLSGCGRRGPLEPPPTPETEPRQPGLFGPGTSGSTPDETAAPDRPFLLDPLI